MHRSGIRAQSGRQDQGGGFAVGGGERIGAPEISCGPLLFMHLLCQSLELLCQSLGREPASFTAENTAAGMPGSSDSSRRI